MDDTLPAPTMYARELISNGGGVWLGCASLDAVTKAHDPGETGETVLHLYSADKVRAIIAECRRPAAMVEAVATYPELTVEQKSAANIWDHVDEVLPVIELARAGKWSPYENMACKYIVLRIDMRDGGCILKNAKGERINPADLRKQYTAGHQWPAWATECHPLADWQKQAIRDAAPVGEKL